MDDVLKRKRAKEMKLLGRDARNVAIEAAGNVIDGRVRFQQAETQAQLQRAYRKPIEPDGLA